MNEPEYDSGPFCRHWSDPYYCELNCRTCGHRCAHHGFVDDSKCDECSCEKYVDGDEFL